MEKTKSGDDGLSVDVVHLKDGTSICAFKKRQHDNNEPVPGSCKAKSAGGGRCNLVKRRMSPSRTTTTTKLKATGDIEDLGNANNGETSGGANNSHHNSPRKRTKVEHHSSGSSGSTLHACSLNTPDTTLKKMYVDTQNRYVVDKRISKVCNRKIGTVITYKIKAESDGGERKLVLKDMWSELDWISSGTMINIVGVQADENDCFNVERASGFVIIEPDRLISVTSIIAQMYCERKAALSRFYVGGGDSAVTFRGVVAHELICRGMQERLTNRQRLMKILKEICQKPPMLERAYGLSMTDDELTKLQNEVIEWVQRFMKQRYIGEGPIDPKYQAFRFKELLGVEDTIWNPTYGMKGKIDATVLIEKGNSLKVLPLEFKTGSTKSQQRQIIKADHVGQVTLYTLMMNIKFGTVEEAMLYYISDDSLSLHPPRIIEVQQLVMKRNKFLRNSTLVGGELPYLPKPDGIDFDFKCKNCDLKNACTLEIRKKTPPAEQLVRTELKLVQDSHLKPSEIAFFGEWLHIINAETEEVEKKFNDKTLWTKSPQEREATGSCITDLKIRTNPCLSQEINGRSGYFVSFGRKKKSDSQSNSQQPPCTLQIDDFIALSSNVEVCINYGIIACMTEEEITILLDQPLHKGYTTGNFTYSVDRISSTSPIASQYGYLAKLMENSPEASRLREYIISKSQPSFRKMQLPDVALQEMLMNLNVEQKRVITKALLTDSFLFVKGAPGSGKTTTIVSLLRALVYEKKTVLVVSYTGTALENILLKYAKHSEEFVKISTSGRTDANLAKFTTKELSKSATKISDLCRLYKQPVVGTTLLSLRHPIFQVRRFDYCIVDEASQALPTAVFGALSRCDKYIVFGDPNQLPPILQSKSLKNRPNFCDNFFSLMAQPASTIKMNIQYRMNAAITKLANELMYDNQMKCGSAKQEKAYIRLTEPDIRRFLHNKVMSLRARKVLCHVVSKRENKAVVFLDTSKISAFERRVEETVANEAEKQITMGCVRLFVGCKLNPSSLGIIAPYNGQVNAIRCALRDMTDESFRKVEVNTVDQYQGREMEAIICSFTKSMPPDSPFFNNAAGPEGSGGNEKEGILQDMRRLNVAITRARRKLVLIGNRKTLEVYNPFKRLFEILTEDQIHQLTTEELEGLELVANMPSENIPPLPFI